MESKPRIKIDEALFADLVRRKWTVSLILAIIMTVVYYGFILLLAFGREILAAKLSDSMTLGLAIGLFVIALSWILTGIYVFWANAHYDDSVKKIINTMRD